MAIPKIRDSKRIKKEFIEGATEKDEALSTELATQHHSFCKAEILSKEEFEQSSLETEKYENSHVELPAPCIDSSTSLKN